MSETKLTRGMAFNCVRAMKFGYKPTKIDRLIMLRSDCTHYELQFTERYGRISFSSTLADGAKGCRFKLIEYSHPEYWDEVFIPVTAEQEREMWDRACDMANMHGPKDCWPALHCYYGPNHIKYDLIGAAFSYWTKFDIWHPAKNGMVCNRACATVVLEVFPDAMDTVTQTHRGKENKQADYASMTPSETDAMFRNRFRRKI